MGEHWVGLAVALGCGLLVGVERERRKGVGPGRRAAGLRTFAVVSLAGALAAASGHAGAVPLVLLAVGALAALAYWRDGLDGRAGAVDSPAQGRAAGAPVDPGLTTEVALVAVCLVGVLAMSEPALAAASGTALALLLALRERLHRVATRWLRTEELHDGLLLAALVLIVLPLVPAGPLAAQGWLAGVSLRPFVLLVVLILGLQAASHLALRMVGAGRGWLLVGLLSGFVSSSAAVLTLGRRVRTDEASASPTLMAAAASASGVATWVQVPLVAAALAPTQAGALLPVAAAGAAATAALAGWWWWRALAGPLGRTSDASGPATIEPGRARVLRLREALVLAALLSGVVLAVAAAQAVAGDAGRLAATLLGALADVHAAVAAQATLAAAGTIDAKALATGVLVAMATNVLSRSVLAAVAGGTGYAARVGAALALGWVAAAGVAGLGGAQSL